MGFFSAIAGPLIGAAGSLIGGRNERKERDRDRKAQSAPAVRADAERGGFNPLFWANTGRSQAVGYAPTFGNRIATAFSYVGDAITAAADRRSQLTRVQQENERLNKIIQRTTLTPKVPGIYGARRNASIQGNPLDNVRPVSAGRDVGNKLFGYSVTESSKFSDAEDVEQRYGDFASSLYGLAVAGADGLSSYGRHFGGYYHRSIAERDAKERAYNQARQRDRERWKSNQSTVHPAKSRIWGTSPARGLAPTRAEFDKWRPRFAN